jgi:hypothetical protein
MTWEWPGKPVILTGLVILLLVNTALFLPDKSDLHDPIVIVGSLVAGVLTQVVLVAVVYGIYRLLRRQPPRMSLPMVALRTLLMLAGLRVLTMALPQGRNAKLREDRARPAGREAHRGGTFTR